MKDLKKIIEKMTLREKIFQLIQLEPPFLDRLQGADFVTGQMKRWKVEDKDVVNVGSILNGAGAEKVKAMQREYLKNNPHGIPLLFMLDVIHGYRTIYPATLGLAASFDMDVIKKCSAMAAKEACVDGVQITFAPMVDLVRDARWGRVVESPGEDPFLCCEFAKAQVEGLQGDFSGYHVGACVKHFAGYGGAEAGRDYNTVDMSERTLREYYLPAYKAAIDAGASLIMSSFNVIDGMPASGNKHLLKDILRNEWGFTGCTISDYGSMWQMQTHGVAENTKDVAYLSMEAGMDIEMMSITYADHLEELISEGKIEESQVDEAVLRVLELKDKLHLFENPYHQISAEKAQEFALCKEHREIAREAAESCAVLMKNEGILPLKKSTQSVAVVGPHAKAGQLLGCWYCKGDSRETVTVYDGLCNVFGKDKVSYALGCEVGFDQMDESKIQEAVALAKNSEAVVLCLGEHPLDTDESASRMYIDLPDVQYKLLDEVLKVNSNVAVVLFTGRPLAMPRLHEKAPAILNMWWPGTEGGNATANLLLGNVVPSGKITMSFPYAVGQCPIYYNHYNTGRPRATDAERCYFQSAYIDGPNAPLYPFGYGLSYTTFAYSPIKLSAEKMTAGGKMVASVKVKNTGNYKAKEVVQLYIRDVVGSVVRPVKELKGFEKIELAVGEEREVSFVIDEEMLAFYNAKLERKAEKGKFRVFIGASSAVQDFAEFELV